MARLHFVKKARKADKAAGIKKGDSYYWWSLRYSKMSRGVIHKSKTKPPRSRLTTSAYYGVVWDTEDAIAATAPEADALRSACEDAASALDELAGEQEEKLNNMPDALQSAPTGELLNERKEACENAAQELRDLAGDIEDGKNESYYEDKITEATDIMANTMT